MLVIRKHNTYFLMMISGTEYRRLSKPGPIIVQFVPEPIINDLLRLVADDDSEKLQSRLKKKVTKL